jgi:hypothetical protein
MQHRVGGNPRIRVARGYHNGLRTDLERRYWIAAMRAFDAGARHLEVRSLFTVEFAFTRNGHAAEFTTWREERCMRVVVPAGILIWSLAGGVLVAVSLTVIFAQAREFPGDSTLVLFLFAAWTAVGVDGLSSMERLWRGPWRRLAVAGAVALPLVLVVAAASQFLTARSVYTGVSAPVTLARPSTGEPLTLARNHQPGVQKPPRWR